VAASLLPWLDRNTVSFYDLFSPYPRRVDYFNRKLVREAWGRRRSAATSRWSRRCCRAASRRTRRSSHLARLQGYRPAAIAVDRVARSADPAGRSPARRGDGLFRL